MSVELRDYQLEAIQKVKENNGKVLLCLPPGSGKTYAAIFLKNYYSFLQKILIVCPASIKYQWENAIRYIHSNSNPVVLNGHYKKGSVDEILNNDWVICNYDILDNNKGNTVQWCDVLSRLQFDLLIIDESHFISNSDALRTRAVQKIAHKIKNRVLLSGTPLMSNITNLYTQLNLVNPTKFPTEKEFKEQYCRFIIKKIYARGKWIRFKEMLPSTPQQIELLKKNMEKDVFTVPPSVVYSSLADITYSDIPFIIDDAKINEKIKELFAVRNNTTRAKAVFSDAMMALGMEKVDYVVNFCKEHSEIDNSKMVIIAHNRCVLEELHKRLKDSVLYYGGMSNENKQKSIKDFVEDSNIHYFIMQEQCATGVNGLQICNTLVWAQLPFTYATYQQCAYRIKRADSTFDKFFVYNVLSNNPLENAVFDTIKERKGITESLFENTDNMDEVSSESNFIKEVLLKISKNHSNSI